MIIDVHHHWMPGELYYRLDPQHLPGFDRPDDGADFFKEGLAQIYVDTAPPYWTSAEVRFAIETLGSDQVLFGSDYPANPSGQGDLGTARKIVEGLPDARVRNKVLGGNTARLLVVQ